MWITQDTSQATTSALDSLMSDMPWGEHIHVASTVWYTYVATGDMLYVDTLHTQFAGAATAIFDGWPSRESLRGSATPANNIPVTPGRTYYIAAFDLTDDGVNGGLLRLRAGSTRLNPTMSVQENRQVILGQDGRVQLSGTYRCENAYQSGVGASISMQKGDVVASGGFDAYFSGTCDSRRHSWSATVESWDGVPFWVGRADVVVTGGAWESTFTNTSNTTLERRLSVVTAP